MKIISIVISIAFLTGMMSCEKAFMHANPETNNQAIFEDFWKVFNEKYAMFEFKGVDWQQEYKDNKPKIADDISTDSLFSILGRMTIKLRDGHTGIDDYDGDQYARYDNESGYLINLEQTVIDEYYLDGAVKRQGDGLKYKVLSNGIGLIEYRDFDKKVTHKMMDAMLTDLKDVNGIILDVRGNGGGDPYYSYIMASHFADEKRYTGYERFRVGPNKEDFADSKIYLSPSSGVNYIKPVAILTNRGCFSATTTLIYYLNPFPNIIFVGDITGGGSGSVANGILANGWNYSLSSSEFIDWEGKHLDDGFEPDIMVNTNPNNTLKDEIIERAIVELL